MYSAINCSSSEDRPCKNFRAFILREVSEHAINAVTRALLNGRTPSLMPYYVEKQSQPQGGTIWPVGKDLVAGTLNSSHQQQNHENQNNQSQTAARIISPPAAIRPSGNAAEQQHNQDNQQQYHFSNPPLPVEANAAPLCAPARPIRLAIFPRSAAPAPQRKFQRSALHVPRERPPPAAWRFFPEVARPRSFPALTAG